VTTAVLLATVGASPGPPAAALPLDGTTPVARLQSQLASRAQAVRLVTRPRLEAGLPLAAPVLSEDVCSDLAALADLVERAAPGPVLLLSAEVVVSDALLDVVLADPRPGLTAVVGPPGSSWPVVTAGGVVTAAASPLHSVTGGGASALGVLRVPQAHRATVSDVARAAADELRRAALPVLPGATPAQDALAVLLVALVRTGTRVATVPLRGFAWARALDAGSAEQAAVRLAEVDEERARTDAAVKPDDGFFGTFFVSPYSKRLARQAARRQIRPNTVTVVSMVLGVVAAALYAQGDRAALVVGAVVLHGALTLDLVDGQLARYTGAFSSLGAYLDAVFDRVKEYLVFAGLSVGAARHGDDVWTLAALALVLQTTHHALQFSWPGGQQPQVLPRRGPLDVRELALPAGPRGPGRIAATVSARTQTHPATRWGKRIVQFPIAERFAVLSLGPALAGPRVTLTVFVAWVCVALAWSLSGRVLRSVST
jgi:phosphatidylglycerophosphate synthase